MDTRREFFKRAAMLSGGAGLAGALLASVQRASAIEPPPASTYLDAEHVVILMQENRSFDHLFGTLRGVRGFNDPRAVTLPDSNPVWLQTGASGKTYAPFRLNIKDTKVTWLGGLPHSWRDQTDARSHGNHDGWLDAKPSGHKECAGMPLTMGYYNREDLPFYYALADAFTVCDQHFCSSLTGTTPNRLYLWTGTIREKPNPDSPANVRNSEVDYGIEAHWTTFPERLEDAGISWKIYQNELSIETGLKDEEEDWLANFTDNPIEWFSQYHVRFHKEHREYFTKLAGSLPGEIETLRGKINAAPVGSAESEELNKGLRRKEDLQKRVAEEQGKWTEEDFDKLPPREKNLHDKAFTTNRDDPFYRQLETLRYQDGETARAMQIPKGDVLHQFREDVNGGQLPEVSWIVAPETFSDHPGAPWYGAWYVSEVLNILTRNADVWRKTIFILTYDENDGYFDHVPPFAAPQPGKPETGGASSGIDTSLDYVTLEQDLEREPPKEARGGPIGLGFRVPLVVASPWNRGGFVCSQVFDHTSVLQFLEKFLSHKTGKDIRETNITAWRRTVCGDLSSIFRPFSTDSAAALPFPPRNSFLESIYDAQFKALPSGFRELSPEEVEQCRQNPQSSGFLPPQEQGIRSSCPLPYQLYAGGGINSDGRSFDLTLEARNEVFGGKSAGSAFHVYTPGIYRGSLELRTRAYAVAPGHRIQDPWEIGGFENDIYHLRVCGPNGFFREFTGSADDPLVAIECEYETGKSPDPLSGNVELRATNLHASRDYLFQITDRAYGGGDRWKTLRAGEKTAIILDLKRSWSWYDFSVRVEGFAQFERRFAGRVETGKTGYSDPAMGRVSIARG
ncbi:MAG TPA: phospholipase C, phosphocholine-specific [Bryobacteraceae bacterium]|nr:phospholipase C, phosphocholine-specific [Bryobacteraceae bacterium]